MIHKTNLQHIVLKGNVIEICNDTEQPCLKILFKPECIQANLKNVEDFYLGDDVNVYCDIEIKDVKLVIGTIGKEE